MVETIRLFNIWAILAIATYLFVSCQSATPSHSLLLRVDSLMDTHPDSALRLLESISHPENLHPADYGEYALLLMQAKDRNYTRVTDDSLIRSAVAYYQNGSDKEREAKAYYYLGRVYENSDRGIEAVEAFLHAARVMPDQMKSVYLGVTYERLGKCLRKQKFYKLSLEMYKKAQVAYVGSPRFEKEGTYRTLKDISVVYIFLNKYDSASYYAQKCLDFAVEQRVAKWISGSYHTLAQVYFMKKEYEKADQAISQSIQIKLDSLKGDKENLARAYCWKGIFLNKLNKVDSARYYLNLGHAMSSKIDLGYYKQMYEIERDAGQWKEAAWSVDRSIKLRDSINRSVDYEKMSRVIARYKADLEENAWEPLRERKWLWVAGGVVCVLCIAIISYKVYLGRKIKINCRVGSIKPTKEHFVFNENVFINCFNNFQTAETAKELAMLSKKPKDEEIKLSKDVRMQMTCILHDFFSDVIKELQHNFTQLSEEDVTLCIYLLLGIPKKVILACTGTSDNAYRSRMKRIRQKMGQDKFDWVISLRRPD